MYWNEYNNYTLLGITSTIRFLHISVPFPGHRQGISTNQ